MLKRILLLWIINNKQNKQPETEQTENTRCVPPVVEVHVFEVLLLGYLAKKSLHDIWQDLPLVQCRDDLGEAAIAGIIRRESLTWNLSKPV